MTNDFEVLSVRIPKRIAEQVSQIARERKVSRAEAARLALHFGAPVALHGLNVNLTRVLFIVEFLCASIDVIMEREHGDVYQGIVTLANQRLDELHG